MKTKLVQSKQKDITILKEKTEQLLHIYDMCTEICSQSSSITEEGEEEAETSV
jgi:hypothetical protein